MKTLLTIFLVATILPGRAQTMSDFGRITLTAYLPEKLSIPSEAKSQLTNKLNQIASNYGMGGTSPDPRFIITANINVVTKDIVAGPPQMFAQNIEVILFIGDAFEDKVYSNVSFSLKGVGTNENKAFINAINNIRVRNSEIEVFIEVAKNKIISYYNTNCEMLLNEAESSVGKQDFNKALYQLQLIPDICKDCYLKALAASSIIYQKKINSEGRGLLERAKIIWASSPNKEGASKAKPLLLKINILSDCYSDIKTINDRIEEKLTADEIERIRIEEEQAKRKHEFALQQNSNDAELERLRINAYREVATEYAKNQPATRTYYRVYWVY